MVLMLYPLLGAGLKYIDDAFDEQVFNKKLAYVTAPVIGVLWTYAMMVHAASASLLLAIVLGVLLKGKIDNLAFVGGMGTIVAISLVVGVQFLWVPLIVLTVAALLDEVGNDLVDKSKHLQGTRMWQKVVVGFFDQRWVAKVAVLVLGLIGMIPLVFFIALLLFDGAYLGVRWYSLTKQMKRKQAPSISLQSGYVPT